jgi:aminoglycoside N3'-acetyltransferase
MIGVDYNVINSFYLAYYLACIENKQIETCKSVIAFNGKRRWINYRDYQRDISIFKDIYTDFIHKGSVYIHLIGNTECRIIEQKSLVDFAKEQLEINMNRMRNIEQI